MTPLPALTATRAKESYFWIRKANSWNSRLRRMCPLVRVTEVKTFSRRRISWSLQCQVLWSKFLWPLGKKWKKAILWLVWNQWKWSIWYARLTTLQSKKYASKRVNSSRSENKWSYFESFKTEFVELDRWYMLIKLDIWHKCLHIFSLHDLIDHIFGNLAAFINFKQINLVFFLFLVYFTLICGSLNFLDW